MAHAPSRVSSLEDGVPLLQGVEARRYLGEAEQRVAAPFEREAGPETRAQRRHRRLAVGQDHRGGGEQRGFDGGKKVRGRKRHLLVDTEGLVVEARVHSARVPDQDGIRRLLEPTHSRLPRLSYLWVDAGYRGRGKEWVEQALGVEVEVVNRSPKPTPEKVLRVWARAWFKEGHRMTSTSCPRARASRTCRVVGSRSAPSRGSPTTGAWPRTTRGCAPPEKP
jgi:hypothetical protein